VKTEAQPATEARRVIKNQRMGKVRNRIMSPSHVPSIEAGGDASAG